MSLSPLPPPMVQQRDLKNHSEILDKILLNQFLKETHIQAKVLKSSFTDVLIYFIYRVDQWSMIMWQNMMRNYWKFYHQEINQSFESCSCLSCNELLFLFDARWSNTFSENLVMLSLYGFRVSFDPFICLDKSFNL